MISLASKIRPLALMLAAGAGVAAMPLIAQDGIWEHQQRVEAQQAEERRMNGIINDLANGQGGESGEPGYAPNSFVSYPPEAWNDWVKHAQETHRQDIEDRLSKDPVYQDLMKGVWTYRQSDPAQSPKICEATFWTRNGGVSFIHLGGKDDFTFLGFFGQSIPSVEKPRTIEMDLIQSGETQRVRALNIHFGSVKSMGMILFNVHEPKILIGAIEDKQDFEIRLNGATIAQGEWHSGLKARDQMANCLKSQGYLARR